MKITEIKFYCPSLNGYVKYPVKTEYQRPWHEEKLQKKARMILALSLLIMNFMTFRGQNGIITGNHLNNHGAH